MEKRVKVFTSQYRYSGPDRLDITVKGNDPIGRVFAPTWNMVNGLKSGTLSVAEYTNKYQKILNASIMSNLRVWDDILHRERIVLVCFCPPNHFCHRHLLSTALGMLGAEIGGRSQVPATKIIHCSRGRG